MTSRRWGAQFTRKRALNVSSDESLPVVQTYEVGMGANAVRRSCPDGVEHGVKQTATLRGGQASLGWLPVLRGEASGGEGLEGALRLRCEDAGAA
jgi:hypothetical protein